MRSNGNVDVSQIAVLFGGGGHRRAAGCQLSGDIEDIIRKIVKEIEKQICGEFKE
jgi:phosphoesterase RecJ-like protein